MTKKEKQLLEQLSEEIREEYQIRKDRYYKIRDFYFQKERRIECGCDRFIKQIVECPSVSDIQKERDITAVRLYHEAEGKYEVLLNILPII